VYNSTGTVEGGEFSSVRAKYKRRAICQKNYRPVLSAERVPHIKKPAKV
jgi:hypothetical protein